MSGKARNVMRYHRTLRCVDAEILIVLVHARAAFDATLRGRNPEWGYRDVAAVCALCEAEGVVREDVVAMPANNFMLVFKRQARL